MAENKIANINGGIHRVWVSHSERCANFRDAASNLINMAGHCRHKIDKNEVELAELLTDIRTESADFIDFLDKIHENSFYYNQLQQIPESPKTRAEANRFYRSLDREAMFYAMFEGMEYARKSMLDLGTVYEQNEVKPYQITEEQYLTRMSKLTGAMDGLRTYFEPTAEDTMDK